MTLEEAIKQLKLMKVFIGYDAENPLVKKMQSALDMGIKALEQQSTLDTRQRERQLEMEYQHGYDKGWEEKSRALEQQPCEDAISRQAVLRLVEQYPSIIGNRCVGLMADIKHLPSVTPTISDIENNFNLGYNCGYLLRSDGLEDSEVVRL